jgi:flagellar basal body-associated protein FliL
VRQAPRASNGRAIIWISVALALVILSVGAVIAWTRHSASADERERRLQQRFQQLRQQP